MATVVSQTSLSAENNYGILAAAISPTPGNALVAIIGWNDANTGTNPVSNVATDANDWWVHLGTSSASGDVRGAIWIAPNLHAGPGSNGGASIVSLALSWFTLGLTGLVVELSGIPPFATTDFAAVTSFSNSASSLTLSATAGAADFVFGVLVSGNNTRTVTSPGGSWTALNTVSINDTSGSGGPGDCKISPVWQAASAGALSAAYTLSGTAPLAGVLVGVKQAATIPALPSANWPVVKTEAAFGFSPGTAQSMPTYTDISAKTFGANAETVIKTSRGRAYELSQPEAGTLGVGLNNQNGQFTPNAAWSISAQGTPAATNYFIATTADSAKITIGTFFQVYSGTTLVESTVFQVTALSLPGFGFVNVTFTPSAAAVVSSGQTATSGLVNISTPVRVSAAWNNVTYGVGSGYVERWPQEWPDLPQWGISKMQAADAIGVLANSKILSAYAGEVLIDSPYAYFPCAEFYPAGSGTANDGAQGLPLSNLSRTNQKPALAMNGVSRAGAYPVGTNFTYHYLETGLQVGLTGDTATTSLTTSGGRKIVFVPSANTILAGDSGTGIGISANTVHNLTEAPGAIYIDPDLPQVATNGLTVEFWGIIPTTFTTSDNQQMFRFNGPAQNYYRLADRADRMLVFFSGGTPLQWGVQFADFIENVSSLAESFNFNDGALHYYAVVVTVSSGQYVATLYRDGAQVNTGTIPTVQVTSDWNLAGIGSPMYDNGGQTACWNYTIAQAAVYGSALPAARILAHYNAGANAWAGDSAVTRVARLMTWAGYGIARAGDLGSPNPLLGPADQVQSQSVAQAAYDCTTAEGGMFYCDGSGNATYRSRTALYNKSAKWVFGDATAALQNSTFETGITPWAGSNGATLSQSTAQAWVGTHSMLLTPDGVTATPTATSEFITVTPGVTYQCEEWVICPAGYGSAYHLVLRWYNSSKVSLGADTTASVASLTAGQWTRLKVSGAAPSTAAYLAVLCQPQGTPSGATLFYQDSIWLTGELPFDQSTSFGYDNSFVYNIVISQRSASALNFGGAYTAADSASENSYFPRGPLQQNIETTSEQDPRDRANWSLAKYKQPSIRVQKITLNPAATPNLWPAALGIEQGDVITVTRRPIGGQAITETCIVQKVGHDAGPNKWLTKVIAIPYTPDNNVLTCGNVGSVGSAAIPW